MLQPFKQVAFVAVLWSARVLLPQTAPATYRYGMLELKEEQLPKRAQIVAFEFDLIGARFTSIGQLPPGWNVILDSDNSSHASFRAKANTGGEPLSVRAIRNLAIEIGMPLENEETFITSAWFDSLTREGGTKRLPVSAYSFLFRPQFFRLKLPTPR